MENGGSGAIKKVGVRVESRFHEIDDEASEIYCYFAEMADAVTEAGSELLYGGGFFTSDEITPEAMTELTGLVRDLMTADEKKISIYTEGELISSDGRIEIRYREPDAEGSDGELGMGRTLTSITFDEAERGLVTITRTGDVNSALTLERGVSHTCAYNTCGAPFILYSTAKRVENGITADGGSLDMIYTVGTQYGIAQYNRVSVNVTVMEDRRECRS